MIKYYVWLEQDKRAVELKYDFKLNGEQWQWHNGICFIKGNIIRKDEI